LSEIPYGTWKEIKNEEGFNEIISDYYLERTRSIADFIQIKVETLD